MNKIPKLEDFQLNTNIYKNFFLFRKDIEKRNQELREIECALEKNKNKNYKVVQRVEYPMEDFQFTLIVAFVCSFYISFIFLEELAYWKCLLIGFLIVIMIDLLRRLFLFIKNKPKYKQAQKELAILAEIEKQIEENSKKLSQEKELTESKVKEFEKKLREYFNEELDSFYSQHLFKQRSDFPGFNNLLNEFEDKINEFKEANDFLLNQKVYFEEAEKYLNKRREGCPRREESAEKNNYKSSYVKNIVEEIKRSEEEKQISPQDRYRVPKKINIDHERIKKIGRCGEKAVIDKEKEFLISIGRQDLAEEVRWVSEKDGDGIGYDILSFFENGKKKYIEVKTTIQFLEAPFHISKNELDFLKEHPEDSYVYRCFLDEKEETIEMLEVQSSPEFFASKIIEPIDFLVKNKKN